MTIRFLRLLLAPALATCTCAFAQQYVISHPGTTLSPADIREVYFGEKQFAEGLKLTPVDSAPLQDQFLAKVLNVDRAKYGSAWTKKAFREGLVQPPVKSGDSEVLEYVKRTPGAIGYVSVSPTGVNVVEKF